jgi:hypothetical protein
MAVLAIGLGIAGCSTSSKEQDLMHQNALLMQHVHELKIQIDSLTHVPSQASLISFTSAGTIESMLDPADLHYLRRRGLAHPVASIKADLVKNRQLIPVNGVLGGTMQFPEERIQVLNRRWVLAYFEDGHKAGEMLLEYSVSPSGKISWKPLETVVK